MQACPFPVAWPQGQGLAARTSWNRAGKRARPAGALDDELAVFERLAQRLQRGGGELGRLVEEQHAAVRPRRGAWTGQADSPTDQRGNGRRMVRVLEGRPTQQPRACVERPGDRVDSGDFERLILLEVGEQAGQACSEHRLAGARRSEQEQVVTAGGGDLQRPASRGLPDHVGEVGLATGGPAEPEACA